MRFIFKLGKYLNMMLILPDSRQTKIPTKKSALSAQSA